MDYGGTVRVARLAVTSGDLLVGDRHGVLFIPPEVPLLHLAQVAEEIEGLEREIFAFCQSPDFSIDGLAELSESVDERWPRPRLGGAT